MKKTQILFCSLLFVYVASAQNEPYRGGASDGHTKTEQVTSLPFPTSFQPFLGGGGDGYAKDEIVTPLGFPNNFAPFIGGNGDGYAAITLTNEVFAFPNHFYAFFGGENDGWAAFSQQGVIILPLTLFQFRGEEMNGMHKLVWKTQQEINTSHFEIQRSQNNSVFSSLGQKAARGNFNGQSQYDFVDSMPSKGKNYYRLKMVDRDGSFKFSPIILLEKKMGLLTMLIYPNPVQQTLNIRLNSIVSGEITWTVHDVIGRKVIHQKTPGNFGQYGVNVAKLPSGVYVLEVLTTAGKETIQFTKQ